jgi:hypothetical protein
MKFAMLAVLLLVGCKSHATPVSIIGISDCDGMKGVVLIDEHGAVYPKRVEELDMDKIEALAESLPKGHVFTAHVCQGVGT